MFNIRLLGTFLLIFCMSAPAIAAIKVATFIGKINYGFDRTGVFGQTMRDLTGLSYKVQFVYDTTLGTYEAIGIDKKLSGGTQYNSISPIIDSSIEINGFQKHFSFTHYYGDVVIGGGGFSYNADDVIHMRTGTSISDYLNAFSYSPVGPTSLESNFKLAPVQSIFGYFNVTEFDNDKGVLTSQAYGTLYSNNVGQMASISGVVPDPEIWLSLSIGFGISGLIMRDRRLKSAIQPSSAEEVDPHPARTRVRVVLPAREREFGDS